VVVRVAVLTDFAAPNHAPEGGVEVVASTLVKALARNGSIDVHVVSSRTGIGRTHSVRLGCNLTVHYFPRFGHAELPTFFLHERLMLQRILGHLHPDLVHVHGLGRYAFSCGSLGYKYALTIHGMESLEAQLNAPRGRLTGLRVRLIQLLEHASVRRAEVVIANSRYVLNALPQPQRNRVVLIQNPVESHFFDTDAVEPCAGRIIWVGRIVPLKAVDVLVRAFADVKRAYGPASLRIIGPPSDPRYASSVRLLVREADICQSVEFVGARGGPDLHHEYAAAAVVALPSLQENAPVVIAEAMAVGRPVVATAVGGVAEFVTDGVTGILCAPSDFGAVATALRQILVDDTLRRRMGRAAQEVARSLFNEDRIAERHVEVYRSIARCAPMPRSGREHGVPAIGDECAH
jgi:glycosyltransferase involved in cell wall biosynthesis